MATHLTELRQAPPQLTGWLMKRSPSGWRQLVKQDMQKRYVTLANARLHYQEGEGPVDVAETKGLVDLLSNDCDVAVDGTAFSVKPKSQAWLTGSFTGADAGRVFEFDAKESDNSSEQWAAAIQSHIDYAMQLKTTLLAKVPLMRRLPLSQHPKMASACVVVTFEKDVIIIKQGELGDKFFVIVDGEASVQITDQDGAQTKLVATLKAGDYFGENALRSAEPRAATVTATTRVEAFEISRQRFELLGLNEQLKFPNRKALGNGNPKRRTPVKVTPKTPEQTEQISNALRKNRFLKTLTDLDDYKVQRLVEVAREETVQPGTTLIQKGELNADSFYIVAEGQFLVDVNAPCLASSEPAGVAAGEAKPALHIGPGGSFGELALLCLEPRAATVKSLEKSVVFVIDRQSFKEVLMKVPDDKVDEYIEHLKQVGALSCLLDDERKEIAKNLVEVQFSEDDLIIEQGQKGNTFYIMYDGKVTVLKSGSEVKTLTATVESGMAQYFGEAALLDNEVRGATIKVLSSEARCLAMDRDTFDSVLGPLKDIIDRKKKGADASKGWQKAKKKIHAMAGFMHAGTSNEREHVLQKDLRKLGILGCGGFGMVELVEHTQTGETYALKALSKGFVVKSGMQKNVMNEKGIQISLNSPFIVKLNECYRSPQKLFFLLEPALGGELYATYSRRGFSGSAKHAQFYVAGTVYAFEYLHNRSIVYRDLKPENLLLTDRGRIKLTDLGLAKYITDKTYTSCGTPDYFAPEIIKTLGHNRAVDWWELGILVFELMSGHPPFESSDPVETYAKVVSGIEKVSFPLSCRGVVGDLCKQLCKKQPSERLPMRAGGVKNVKEHAWFVGSKFDWEAMKLFTLEPPYKPVVKDNKDLSNFVDPASQPRQIEYKDDGSDWDATFATV